jgi:hypothetical protein
MLNLLPMQEDFKKYEGEIKDKIEKLIETRFPL